VTSRVRFPIRRKLLAALMAATLLPLLVVAVYVRVWTERSLTARVLDDIEVDCREAANALENALSGARDDVLVLSRSPEVADLARLLSAETDSRLPVPDITASRRRVEALFLGFSDTKRSYDQVRFLDPDGREIVRINFDGDRSFAVPEDQLQDKSQRYYFEQANSLPAGQVYVSRLDLNREQGAIERPLKPVLRYATPVFTNGRRSGVLVTNMLAKPFLDNIRALRTEEHGHRMLVDQDGFYLAHRSRSKEWGAPHDLNTGQSFSTDYRDAADTILPARRGTADLADSIASYRRISPCPWDQDCYWMLIQEVPKSAALAPVWRFRLALGAVFAVSLLGALSLSLYLSRRLSNPLREVERGARLLGDGRLDHRVSVQTGDEVEVLADAFNQMAHRLAEARDQERLAFVGRTAAGIVHDIKNPLTSIKGFADLLTTAESPEERQEFSRIIGEDADRILSMVQELLDFSRGTPADLELEPTSAKDIAADLARAVGRDMERAGVALDITTRDDAFVRVDKDRILRVLTNLASNAREAMQETGGTLSVEIGRFDDTVRIVLQDTGPGVPDEIANTVFEPFVTHGKQRGTGLGLAICKQIVAAHGGAITLDPSSERGARFVIELPAHEPEAQTEDSDTGQ